MAVGAQSTPTAVVVPFAVLMFLAACAYCAFIWLLSRYRHRHFVWARNFNSLVSQGTFHVIYVMYLCVQVIFTGWIPCGASYISEAWFIIIYGFMYFLKIIVLHFQFHVAREQAEASKSAFKLLHNKSSMKSEQTPNPSSKSKEAQSRALDAQPDAESADGDALPQAELSIASDHDERTAAAPLTSAADGSLIENTATEKKVDAGLASERSSLASTFTDGWYMSHRFLIKGKMIIVYFVTFNVVLLIPQIIQTSMQPSVFSVSLHSDSCNLTGVVYYNLVLAACICILVGTVGVRMMGNVQESLQMKSELKATGIIGIFMVILYAIFNGGFANRDVLFWIRFGILSLGNSLILLQQVFMLIFFVVRMDASQKTPLWRKILGFQLQAESDMESARDDASIRFSVKTDKLQVSSDLGGLEEQEQMVSADAKQMKAGDDSIESSTQSEDRQDQQQEDDTRPAETAAKHRIGHSILLFESFERSPLRVNHFTVLDPTKLLSSSLGSSVDAIGYEVAALPNKGYLFIDFLSNPQGFQLFRKFCISEFSNENLFFIESMYVFKRSVKAMLYRNRNQVISQIQDIFKKFFTENAPWELNVTERAQRNIRKCMRRMQMLTSEEMAAVGSYLAGGATIALREFAVDPLMQNGRSQADPSDKAVAISQLAPKTATALEIVDDADANVDSMLDCITEALRALDEVIVEVLQLTNADSYKRFQRTKEYRDFLSLHPSILVGS